jgi:hypothetical protein
LPGEVGGTASELLSCDLNPAQLATWALVEARVTPPVPSVSSVALALGISRVQESSTITKAGCLAVDDGDLVVIVRPGNRRWQRFTLAHELGHYLLAVHQGIPLTEQFGDRRAERYCNSFASHFLLPRRWLRQTIPDQGANLDVLLSLANAATCTSATAMGALIDAGVWAGALGIWRIDAGVWRAQTCLRPGAGLRLGARDGTGPVLDHARDDVTVHAALPVSANGTSMTVDVEMRREGRAVITLSSDRELLRIGLANRPLDSRGRARRLPSSPDQTFGQTNDDRRAMTGWSAAGLEHPLSSTNADQPGSEGMHETR